MKKKISMMIISFIGLLFIFSACELNDWDVVLNSPSAPLNVSVTNVEEADGYTDRMAVGVEFTVAEQREWEVFSEHQMVAIFYYRKAGNTAESAIIIENTKYNIDIEMENTPQSTSFNILKTAIENGEEYIITIRFADSEGQLSDPADTAAEVISW